MVGNDSSDPLQLSVHTMSIYFFDICSYDFDSYKKDWFDSTRQGDGEEEEEGI